MSNVQIEISNDNVTEVRVQTLSGTLIRMLSPGNDVWFEVVGDTDVKVEYNQQTSAITVWLAYVKDGTSMPVSSSEIVLDLYDSSPVNVQAIRSMRLLLRLVSEAAVDGPEGVKCGEIIIYPPA